MKDYPTYEVSALERNISQAEANIKTYEGIIEDQYKEIRELRKLVALCKERDEIMQKQT
jgi:hypothetical protein